MSDNVTLPDTGLAMGETVHLFGACGADGRAVTEADKLRRERLAAETARVSGTFYVSRMTSMFGQAKAPRAA